MKIHADWKSYPALDLSMFYGYSFGVINGQQQIVNLNENHRKILWFLVSHNPNFSHNIYEQVKSYFLEAFFPPVKNPGI